MKRPTEKKDFSVALLAPRSTIFGSGPCGGSEVILREDLEILEQAGIPVRIYARAVDGALAKRLPVRTNLPLVSSLEYCGRFIGREPCALVMAYNEPTVAVLAPDRSIIRFDWVTPLPRYWRFPFSLPRFQRSLYLFPSESERGGFLNSHPGIPASRSVVIPNGVDTKLFSPQDRPANVPRVGFAGQWVARKGIEVLLDAWETVHQELPEAELWLAGGPDLWKASGVQVAREAMPRVESAKNRRVRVVGELPRHEMPGFWNSLTVAAVPSLYEPFGLVALEALSCGVPVVASRVGGLQEIISAGECGALVTPGRADELAQALLAVLKNESLRKRLAAAARERAMLFTVARRGSDLLRLLESRMDERGVRTVAAGVRGEA